MLTYTSLLVACLVLSAVGYFLYKVVADSSRSVYRSKAPMALFDSKGHHHKDPMVDVAVAGNSKAFGENRGRTTPKNFARTYPAIPTESVDWKWSASGVQLREPPLQRTTGQPGTGPGISSHCSLYDVNTPQPARRARPNTGKLHREETLKPVGRSYKVNRIVAHVDGDNPDLNKPWGW